MTSRRTKFLEHHTYNPGAWHPKGGSVQQDSVTEWMVARDAMWAVIGRLASAVPVASTMIKQTITRLVSDETDKWWLP